MEQQPQPNHKEHNMNILAPPQAELDPYYLPPSVVRSGHVLALGIVLRVDRCAPEHGGGLLLMLVGKHRQVVISSDEQVQVYGSVSARHLAALRLAEPSNIDYTKGIR